MFTTEQMKANIWTSHTTVWIIKALTKRDGIFNEWILGIVKEEPTKEKLEELVSLYKFDEVYAKWYYSYALEDDIQTCIEQVKVWKK